MLLEREPHAQVTNRRRFLEAAIAGVSALAVPASIAAATTAEAPLISFPPALRQEIADDLLDLHQTSSWVAADVRHDEPGWTPTLQNLHALLKGDPHFRVERIAGSFAYVGYTDYDHAARRAHCVLYLPQILEPKAELDMLGWAAAYHWRHSQEAYYEKPLPSIYGHNSLETARGAAVLEGLAYQGADVKSWREI